MFRRSAVTVRRDRCKLNSSFTSTLLNVILAVKFANEALLLHFLLYRLSTLNQFGDTKVYVKINSAIFDTSRLII